MPIDPGEAPDNLPPANGELPCAYFANSDPKHLLVSFPLSRSQHSVSTTNSCEMKHHPTLVNVTWLRRTEQGRATRKRRR